MGASERAAAGSCSSLCPAEDGGGVMLVADVRQQDAVKWIRSDRLDGSRSVTAIWISSTVTLACC